MEQVNGHGGAITPANQKSPQTLLGATASRDMQEVQAEIFLARQFPRDIDAVFTSLEQACRRYNLAERAMYAYPRAGEQVTGPSIRLAEAIAQTYGNCTFGIRELSQEEGRSVVQAYARDMETNVRQEKIFTVAHKRKANNTIYSLTDPRDIYEHTANHGARRLRACILGIIPGYIVDQAVEWCEETLKRGGGKPLSDRIEKMRKAFGDLGVTPPMIEQRLGHRLSETTDDELVDLQKVYRSIKDGFQGKKQFFETGSSQAGSAQDLNEAFQS